MALLRFEGVSKRFHRGTEEVIALDDVDLVVEAASCLASMEIEYPDTGNLGADLRGFCRTLVKSLATSPAGRVMPVMAVRFTGYRAM